MQYGTARASGPFFLRDPVRSIPERIRGQRRQ
jgi:hypothetical protein